MSIRTLIVDDEKKARDGLELLVKKQTDLSLVQTCKNGIEAIETLQSLEIDLLLLDIQMPGVNGFEVLRSIPESKRPKTIFVTAYDQYAIKAFEYHAIDYLLKPFSDQRFQQSIEHVKNHFVKPGMFEEKIDQLLSYLSENSDEKQLVHKDKGIAQGKLVIKSNGKILLLPYEDIILVEGMDYYVKVHLANEFHLVNTTLKNTLTLLPDESFIQTHKSFIVNVSHILEMESLGNTEYDIKLSNGLHAKVSRTFKDSILPILEQRI